MGTPIVQDSVSPVSLKELRKNQNLHAIFFVERAKGAFLDNSFLPPLKLDEKGIPTTPQAKNFLQAMSTISRFCEKTNYASNDEIDNIPTDVKRALGLIEKSFLQQYKKVYEGIKENAELTHSSKNGASSQEAPNIAISFIPHSNALQAIDNCLERKIKGYISINKLSPYNGTLKEVEKFLNDILTPSR